MPRPTGEGTASTQSPGVTPAVAAGVPAAPEGLSVNPGDATVTVSWTTVANAKSCNVHRSTSAGTQGPKIGSSSTTPYVDAAASNGSTCYYTITLADRVQRFDSGPATRALTVVSMTAPERKVEALKDRLQTVLRGNEV
jgi:fibronectin type 3 domain-containing protein